MNILVRAVLTFIALAMASPSVSEVALLFEDGSLAATGLSPGGEAALIGLEREARGTHTRVVPHRESGSADAAGVWRYAVEAGERSVWAVVDVESGEVALAAPAAFGLRNSQRLYPEVTSGLTGAAPRLALRRESVTVLVVRPGAGAWLLEASDGGSADGDGVVDGVVDLSYGELAPLGTAGESPSEPASGDVVVVLDPQRLESAVLRLSAAMLGEESVGQSAGNER